MSESRKLAVFFLLLTVVSQSYGQFETGCSKNPCQNGGTCVSVSHPNTFDSFQCKCPSGFTGLSCQIGLVSKASQNPCTEQALRSNEVKLFKNPSDKQSFLMCVDVNRFREMKCPPGTFFNEELSTCVTEDFEQPQCPPGYCLNDGECLNDERNMLKCACQKGFTGEHCEVNIDECALEGNAACSGGHCIDQVDGYYCLCQSGHVGLSCQQSMLNPCTVENLQADRHFFEMPSPNSNVYIQCLGSPLQLMVRKCPANQYWHQEQETCSLERPTPKFGICLTFPCRNGGECHDDATSANGFMCACKPGYTGIMCEQIIDFCASNPCQNDGKCMSYAGGYTCICKNNVIDECCCNGLTNPCPSKKAIIPGVNNYFEHSIRNRYIHCDFDGRAFIRTCAPGTAWNQAVLTCTPDKSLMTPLNTSSTYGYGAQQSLPSYGSVQTPIQQPQQSYQQQQQQQQQQMQPMNSQPQVLQTPANSYGPVDYQQPKGYVGYQQVSQPQPQQQAIQQIPFLATSSNPFTNEKTLSLKFRKPHKKI